MLSCSLQLHGTVATRLQCPWNSQGKSTGVGCHFRELYPISFNKLYGKRIWKRIYNHFAVHLKLTQHFKLTILQFKKITHWRDDLSWARLGWLLNCSRRTLNTYKGWDWFRVRLTGGRAENSVWADGWAQTVLELETQSAWRPISWRLLHQNHL